MFEPANSTHFYFDVQGLDTSAKLQVLSFEGVEAISSDYAVEITLVCDHLRYDITKLLSKPAFLSFDGNRTTGIHGTVQSVKRAAVGNHYATFKVILTPTLTHLKKRINQRVFRTKTVPQIISTILSEYGLAEGLDFAFKLKDSSVYTIREYTTQYDQSDYDFINHLAESEGLFYFFTHSKEKHVLTFADANPFFPSLADAIRYQADTGLHTDKRVIKRFDINVSSCTTEASFRNYNFTNMKIPEGNAKGTQSEKENQATEPSLESYDYPSRHLNKKEGDRLSLIEIERLRASQVLAEADSDVVGLHAGLFISVTNHPLPDTEQPWLIREIRHAGKQPSVLEAFGDTSTANTTTSASQSQLYNYFNYPLSDSLAFSLKEFNQGYRNVSILSPRDVPYRPQKFHPKPKVLGTQTAIVTGAAGEEIYCDEYGRVKIQCHWDRQGQYNENSSDWVRVRTGWAHKGYGAVAVPRVGMEVLIQYEEGDPDFPMIVGALHNGKNKVPYELPAHKTRSVFKTSSSKGGVGSNEIRIEDLADQEQIFVQAQKDFDQLTKHNHTVTVGNNSHLQVQNEHSETIVGNRYQEQQAEEHHLTIKDRKTQLMMNDYKMVTDSEHTTIGTILSTEAGIEIHLKASQQIVVDGGLSLTLKAGGQHIVLNPAGIFTTPIFTGGVPMEGTPAMPISSPDKEIVDIWFSHSDEQIKIDDISRFYVDLNVHILTRNYSEGELVKATINTGSEEFDVFGKVNEANEAVVTNIFQNRGVTINSEKSSENFISSECTEDNQEIIDMWFSYGDEHIKVTDVSRFYTDLNLHILTKNYQEGDLVKATIETDDEQFEIFATVNNANEAIATNIFNDKKFVIKD